MGSEAEKSLTIQWVGEPNGAWVHVRLAGEIDLNDEDALTALAGQLSAYKGVYLDTADVRFAGTDFVHFLLAVRRMMPADGFMAVCRPRPMTMKVLTVTGVDIILAVREALPVNWMMAGAE